MIRMQQNQCNTNGDGAALAEAGDTKLPLDLLFAVSKAADSPEEELLLSETDNGFLICSLLLSLGGSSVQSDILSMTGKAFPFMKWSLGNTSSLDLCNTRSQTMPLNLGFLQGFG